MARRTGFYVEGLSQVIRDLHAIGVEVEDLKGAFSKLAELGANIAEAAAPKLTGALAASIRGNRAKSKAVVTAGRASVPYAGVQNYGWPAHNISPSGFLERADQQLQHRAIGILEAEINQQIRRRGMSR